MTSDINLEVGRVLNSEIIFDTKMCLKRYEELKEEADLGDKELYTMVLSDGCDDNAVETIGKKCAKELPVDGTLTTQKVEEFIEEFIGYFPPDKLFNDTIEGEYVDFLRSGKNPIALKRDDEPTQELLVAVSFLIRLGALEFAEELDAEKPFVGNRILSILPACEEEFQLRVSRLISDSGFRHLNRRIAVFYY